MSVADLIPPEGNAKAYSVSELSSALKRTLEDAYGFVRLRGEVSKVTRHASGHVYLTLKDEKACIDGVVWKMTVRGLKAQPQQGLEVIVTGRITTYAAGSRYQIVIETMEHAGVGALLAQLERLKTQLRGEGLFDAARKQRVPVTPAVVGVITSPTGAVIRDILHRIRDRWPCRVVVWPVVVQGDRAAAEVVTAIRGFNALAPGGPVPRPDVIIVARGGGSVEDLWPFNDEALARAVSAGSIPLISAVGHETDTTLIDFVSDLRAPTPTGAAELATPVLAELRASVRDLDARLGRWKSRSLEGATQRFDFAASRLDAALQKNTAVHAHDLVRTTARFTPALLQRPGELKAQRLTELSRRLDDAVGRYAEQAGRRARLPDLEARLKSGLERRLKRAADQLDALEKLRVSFNPERPLDLGFALVRRASGTLARAADELAAGETVQLKFKEGERSAVIDGGRPARAKPLAADQGKLF
ncbi:MAG TPA: exodeoxyribonuclease VII large subunit [Caulobacteraceae bacterium]|jgi:exodeoxyribonuclease VII large subunit